MSHNYGNGDFSHCAIGAVEVAAEELKLNKTFDGVSMAWLADIAMRLQLGSNSLGSIPSWNDAPGRTEGEVRDMLLSTAKDLRNSINEGE